MLFNLNDVDMDYQNNIKEDFHCKFNFRCREVGENNSCEVLKRLNDNYLFVSPKSYSACKHKLNYGCSVICSCPVKAGIGLEKKRDYPNIRIIS